MTGKQTRTEAQTSEPDCWSADPPRQEIESYGEPVAKEQIGETYWEAYSSDKPDLIFIVKYEWQGSEWVKLGMDRHRVSELFNSEGWPTN